MTMRQSIWPAEWLGIITSGLSDGEIRTLGDDVKQLKTTFGGEVTRIDLGQGSDPMTAPDPMGVQSTNGKGESNGAEL
jgi:hypothetical protein